MRELKFRAYETYGDNGKFRYISTNEDLNYWAGDPSKGEIKPLSAFNWQQFTGRQDKNNKDLYEGDVCIIYLIDDESEIMVLEWNNESNSYVFVDCNKEKYFFTDATFEIIGNIYETPELING